MQTSQPFIPERSSSLQGPVTKDDELLYLAGRKPYSQPTTTSSSKEVQLTISTSYSSLASESVAGLAEGETMNRIFNGSSTSLAVSDDSTSVHSATSDLVVPDSRRNLLRPLSAPGQGQGFKSGSAPRPESPNLPG